MHLYSLAFTVLVLCELQPLDRGGFLTEYHQAGGSKSIGTKTVYGKKEHSDFLIVKLSFILYLTTQESTSEAGILPVVIINTDISERARNTSKHAESHS